MSEPLNVDLSYGTLKLWECGYCKAITLKESAQAHIEWHQKAGV